MKINNAGLNIIKESESLHLKSYLCPAGVWTVGWGHTEGVQMNTIINEVQAQFYLTKDLGVSEKAITKMVKVPLSENQFSALVSFVFNVGVHAFGKSTLLRKLNQGDYESVPHELKRWVKGGGKMLSGLVKRREAESKLWMQES